MVTTETEMRASTGHSSKGRLIPEDGQAADIIQVLGNQLDQYEARIQRLQMELVNATTEKHDLLDELQATLQRVAPPPQEIGCVPGDNERAQADNDKQDSRTNKRVSSKVEADYRDALLGMESALRDREAAAAELENDKAELFRRIMLLERRCAELDGLRADRENTCAELRKTLDDRSRQVERMNKYIIRVQRELKILNDEIDSAESSVGSLDGVLAEPDEAIAASAMPPEIRKKSSVSPVTHLRPVNRQEQEPRSRAGDHGQVAQSSGTNCRREAPATDQAQGSQNDTATEQINKISIPEQFIIVPIGDDVSGPQYPLSKNELTIGRSRDHDIPVPERNVSRVHARVILRGFKVFIEDMGSKHGLLVNSEAKERQELKHGDRFTIGRQEFELVDLAIRADGLQTTPAA